MIKIYTNKNERIERIEREFYTAVQDVPAYDPFSLLEGRETREQWANQWRNFEADLIAEGVVL